MNRFLAPSLLLVGLATAQDITYPQVIHQYGTRGLPQTRSAEALGEGFLVLSGLGSYHQVERSGSPLNGEGVTVGTLALGLGVSDWADLSAWTNLYNVPSGKGVNPNSGYGSNGVQVQVTAPWDTTVPFRLAVQGGLVSGSADAKLQSSIDASGKFLPDGWNYFETRTGYDFQGRILQTVRWGSESFPVRIHFNEGLVHSIEANHPDLVLLDAGLELDPHPILTLGVEGHIRTVLEAFDATDPAWVTASFGFHLPADVQFLAGADLRLSKDRTVPASVATTLPKQALDPWRAFGGLAISFDLAGPSRRARRDALVNDSLERVSLQGKVVQSEASALALGARIDSLRNVAREKDLLRDSLNRRLKDDSVRLESCRKDGSNARNQVARMNDSLTRRSAMDSAALADARRQIEEEKLKRGDLEASFLRTGMLNLDAVYFDLGKATITPNSRPYLNLIGAILVKYPKLNFEVGGHTDNKGLPKTNQKLSQSRAQAVLTYLTQTNPDLAGHIAAKGYGDTKPKATNKTPEGREMNRRVEITVTNLDVLKEYTKH